MLINATLIVEYLAFYFVPYIPPLGQWNYVINFVVNHICIFNNTISPLILFALNDEIRRTLSTLRTSVAKVMPLSLDRIGKQ